MPDEPVLKMPLLTAEQRKRLEEAEPDIAKAKVALDALKSFGIDVSTLEDKVTWATEVRKTLLEKF